MHDADLVAALVDTACGFAAYTVSGMVAASYCAVTYLTPGTDPPLPATEHTIKAGRREVFTRAELHGERDGVPVLIAQGETLLIPLG